MLSNYILSDILQYIFNLYIDWENDIAIISEVLNFNFSIKPHLHIEETYSTNKRKVVSTYIDEKISKTETYYEGGIKSCEKNYKNGLLEGNKFSWYTGSCNQI